jgi:hypothetical protein
MVASELAGSTKVAGGKLPAAKAVPAACAGCPLVTVFVCRKCKGHDKVADYLAAETRASIKTVRCQKVCKGPVAAISVGGRMEYFGRLKGAKSLAAMARLTNQRSPHKIPKRLRKRLSRERSGRRPR